LNRRIAHRLCNRSKFAHPPNPSSLINPKHDHCSIATSPL
jgi:hypothetical protein